VVIRRGEIWWATLPEPAGSEAGYRRPLLIVQSNNFNRSRIRTVVAVGITSNLEVAEAPGNVLLPRDVSGLPKDSVANVSQVVTVDKSLLMGRVGRLNSKLMAVVEVGLRLVLSL
jgi:mRNA interferase MazF